MQKRVSESPRAGPRPGSVGDSRAASFNVLLVSRDPAWFRAVQGARRALGPIGISTCGGRDAVARLAGTGSRYSHLLVDRTAADGLLDELADLATGMTGPGTDMLVLGVARGRRSSGRVISTATPRSVVEALMTSPAPRTEPAMDLAELRAALKSAMIETRYQPIVRVADRCPVGLEALVRLNHPRMGTLLPDRFVPQIEDAGLAAELTDLVSARAFADLAGVFLRERGFRMSVNFPLDVVLMPAALARLEEQRASFGIAADRVVVELTESRPVEDIPALRRALEHLRGLGYGVAIDDVTPDVPRLAPLLELPFSSLKFDKSVVQGAERSEVMGAFIAATTERAKARGLVVVAEGVESEALWEQMAAIGVDEVQGFLAARPLPVAAVPVWWDAWVGTGAPGK